MVLFYAYMKLHAKTIAEEIKIILLVMAFVFAFYDKPIVFEDIGLAFTPRVSLTILAGVELNIPEVPGPSFRTFKANDPEHQGRAEIIGLFRHRSPAFRICKATFLCAKPGLSYSKPGVVVYLIC